MLIVACPAIADAAPSDPAEAITLEPAFVFVEAAPGERVTRTVLIKNQTRVDARIAADVFDMEASPGASTAFDYVEVGDARRGAGEWVRPMLEGGAAGAELAAGTELRIQIVIEIPDDAGAGGHYAALRLTGRDPRPTQELQGEIEVHAPILVSVAGDATRDLRVSIRPGDTLRWGGGDGEWTVELRNDGDLHEVFAGRILVDGALSGSRRLNLRPGILLPGERRVLRVPDNVREGPDRITAAVTVAREDGETIRATAPSVLVLPWWLIVIGGAAIVLVIWRVRRRRRAWREYHEDLSDPTDREFESPAG